VVEEAKVALVNVSRNTVPDCVTFPIDERN
jgi:hypothetical protein